MATKKEQEEKRKKAQAQRQQARLDRKETEAKKKQDVAARRKVDTRKQLSAGKTFTSGGRKVTRAQFEQEKKAVGTATGKVSDAKRIRTKQEATRLGLKAPGETLGTADVKRLEERTKEQEAQVPALEEAGVFEDRPTEQTDIVQSVRTEEGRREVKAAAETELAQQRLALFEAQEEQKLLALDKQKISDTIQKVVGVGLLETKAVGELVGDVEVIGPLITGLTGDRKEIVQNVQSSLEARNQMATKIGTLVKEGSMNPEDGFKALNRMEAELNADLTILKREAILSPAVRRSGELIDIQVDLLELEQEIFDAKINVAGGALQESNPAILTQRLEELEELVN